MIWPRRVAVALLALVPLGCGTARAPAPEARALEVAVTIDYGTDGRAPRRELVHLPAGSSVLAATRAMGSVQQAWVCCSDEDVFAIDGLASDPARDGYWTWWLGDALGPGFAHEVALHGGESITWTYRRAGPQGLGAEPVTRMATLTPQACAALASIGADRNLVAHAETCELQAHGALPRLAPGAPDELLTGLQVQWLVPVGPRALPAGVRAVDFGPGSTLAQWEALGSACGRLGAARVAWHPRALQ